MNFLIQPKQSTSFLTKIVKFGFLVLFSILLFTNIEIYAQPDDCYPDWQNYECEYGDGNLLFQCPPIPTGPWCEVNYNYQVCKLLDNNGNIIERRLQILDYQYQNCGCPDNILENIISSIINKEAEFFGYTIDSCWTEFKVQTAICWEDIIQIDGSHLLKPCDIVGCCLTKYTVCFDYACPGGNCPINLKSIVFDSSYTSGNCGLTFCESICHKLWFSKVLFKKNTFELGNESVILSLYPNPAVDILNIYSNINLIGYTYKIVNLKGEFIQEGNFEMRNFENITINIDKLQKGIYTIQIINNEESFSLKFIK